MRRTAKLPPGWFYCFNCGKSAKLGPRRPEGSQRFCTPNCRKEFWKHGGVSVLRLREHVRGWIREYLKEMLPGLIAAELKAHFEARDEPTGNHLAFFESPWEKERRERKEKEQLDKNVNDLLDKPREWRGDEGDE